MQTLFKRRSAIHPQSLHFLPNPRSTFRYYTLQMAVLANYPPPAFVTYTIPRFSTFRQKSTPLKTNRFLCRMLGNTAPKMSSTTHKYVILGAGNSAGYAVRELIKNGNIAPNDLCIVGSESVLPYERPALSKAVLVKEQVRLPKFHTCVGGGGDPQPPEWYQQHGVVTRLGKPVTAFDPSSKTLNIDGDSVTATDALILATGSDVIRLSKLQGHDLNGIHYLREYDQALKLYDALQANIGKTVIIVGGGYIGMEVAAAAATVGCKVKMIFPENHLMSRLFTEDISKHYEKVYADKGITLLHKGRVCHSFLDDGQGNVRGVVICQEGKEDKEEEGTLVVVGVGARPNTSLFKDLNMDDRGGVVVDGTLKTSADGVYAIGDIATFPLKMYGDRPARMEHVQNARESAKHAVNAIVSGSKDAYDYLPYFYSRVFHLSWKFYGDNSGECVVIGDFNPQLLAVWVESGGAVKGIFMESPSDENTAQMIKVAKEGRSINVEEFRKCKSVDDGLAMLA